jgi:hypothetical protein
MRAGVGKIEQILAAETPNAEAFNLDNVFMLYAAFCGDVDRTAHASSLTPTQVIDLAAEGKWNEKLKSILELKRSSKPGDVERAINRALNFVQAHRMRLFLERVVQRICAMPSEELDELLISYQKTEDGSFKRLSTRAFADLSSALEKCHMLTYLALNDSTTERRARDDKPDAEVSGGELHAKIAAAMANYGKPDTETQSH